MSGTQNRGRSTISRRALLRYGAIGLAAATLPGKTARAGSDPEIVSCAIHPAIGVARVGNSPAEYFIGPEIPGVYPQPDGGFKDAAGRIKRQAARFRVYGLDAQGNVVRELTADEATVTWTVHLANSKAGWYRFDRAFDIPEATGQSPSPGAIAAPALRSGRRNAGLTGAGRSGLIIDPGVRTIAGRGGNSNGGDGSYAFNTGQFMGQIVPLGELRTDDHGRLLVLGGAGNSGPPTAIRSTSGFANNDGWYDDISDGPVEATVQLRGRTLTAAGAWVVVGPPNFGPGLLGVVTMYDVVFEAATKLDPARAPDRPSFTRQIYPLFERLVQNQWVNAGISRQFGWGTTGNLLTTQTLAVLSDASSAALGARTDLYRRFRDPTYSTMQPNALPPYYGDNATFPAATPRAWLALLPSQYGWLRRWAAGDFDADWPAGGLQFPTSLDSLPADEQAGALDRAALDDCLGGPFHPGCELPWIMRQPLLYSAPFRIKRRVFAEQDWGDAMTSAVALSSTGPLALSGAGDLTRWMIIPWQADTADCLSAYEPLVDQYLPTFWPARVPNDVLTAQSYATIMAGHSGSDQRVATFTERHKWLRGNIPHGSDPNLALVNQFLTNWSRYGIISPQPGPGDDSLPSTFWVETGRDPALDQAPVAN